MLIVFLRKYPSSNMVVIFGFVAFLVIGVSAEKDVANATEEVCHDGLVDATTRTQDGSTYLFRGDYYWKIDGGIVEGYPKLIKDDWIGVEGGSIDAAFTWNDGSTFIFKGDSYWRFYNKVAEVGYPKKIADGFRGIPNDIDAALVWNNNGYTYFFKGSQYWRYRPKSVVPTNGNYPSNISYWKGVPDNLSAAIRWEGGRTYFFKGSKYYRYENDKQLVTSKYPVTTGDEWFECEKNVTETSNFERERSHTTKKDSFKILSSIDELKASMEKHIFSESEIRKTVNAIKEKMDLLIMRSSQTV